MPQPELLPKFMRPARDSKIVEHPLVAIAREQLKAGALGRRDANYWYICKLGNGLDLFIGEAVEPLEPYIMEDLIRRHSFSRNGLAKVRTAFGETVEAAINGVINKPEVTEEQKRAIARFANPYREAKADVHPEIFTFSSAFNHVKRDWPMINNLQHIEDLSSSEREYLLADLLQAGLGVLEQEAKYKHINLAAKRMRILGGSPRLGFHIAHDIYAALMEEKGMTNQQAKILAPEPHSLVYFPNFDTNAHQMGGVIVPTEWMWAAFKRPIPALCSLLYVSSMARDDYYGKLRGSEVYFVRGFGADEVPNQTSVAMRAEGLVAQFHREVDKYDGRVYLISSKADGYMWDIQRKYPYGALDHLYYPDPPPGSAREGINQNV